MNRRLMRFLRRLPLVGLWVDALEDRALERRMKEQGQHAILRGLTTKNIEPKTINDNGHK